MPHVLAVFFAAVERGEHTVHAPVIPREPGADCRLRVAAEDKPPAAQAFVLIHRAHPHYLGEDGQRPCRPPVVQVPGTIVP